MKKVDMRLKNQFSRNTLDCHDLLNIYIINGFICFSIKFLIGIMQIKAINKRVGHDV